MDRSIKPYAQQQREKEMRARQVRLYRRNQLLGLLLLALAVVVWTLFHTHLSWVFPAGWWRL